MLSRFACLILFGVLNGGFVLAQDSLHSVISCGGGSMVTTGSAFDFTVGEPITATVSIGGDKVLTQGFQQVYARPGAVTGASISLHAMSQGEKVALTWSIQKEQGASYYVIERKDTSGQFIEIDSVVSKSVGGTSTGIVQYLHADKNPLSGINIYRVILRYGSGNYAVSNIDTVDFRYELEVLNVYPSPVSDLLTVKLSTTREMTAVVRVFDEIGRMVAADRIAMMEGENHYKIRVGHLATGYYFVQFAELNGRLTKVIRILKR